MDTMDTTLNRCPKTVPQANTNPEQLSLPRELIVAEEIQINTGAATLLRISKGNFPDNHVNTMFTKSLGIHSIIAAIVSRSSSPEVLACTFSFPGSQSFSCGDC
jgi:hypothetical protein